MKSVNKVILIGNLGKDPEVKSTNSGKSVANFSLATNERFKGSDGEYQERTEWHNIVLWEKLAEISSQYLKKGSKIYLEGRIQTRSWEDKESGQKRYMTEVVGADMVMLDRKDDGVSSAPKAEAPQPAPASSSPITDEDLPF
jgi:single-strand DNA-binding protein